MRPFVILLALALNGCATIIEGTTQTITVDVSPPHGICIVTRQGEQLGMSTPEKRVVVVGKSQHDLIFQCQATGYQPKTDNLQSAMAAMTVASFFLVDLGIVDAATGAWKKYPDKITIVMQPLTTAAR